jgi:prepilin signal peptidase PulO-like enzyme (type II secretory pathway)
MKNLSWIVVGALSGWWCVLRARKSIATARSRNEPFGEAHIADRSITLWLTIGLSGFLFGMCANNFEHDITVLAFAVLIAYALQLALIDIDTHLLPRRTVFAAVSRGMALLVIALFVDSSGSLLRIVVGATALWCCLRFLQVLSRGDLGSGDVRLGVLLGMYLGWVSYEAIVVGLLAGFVSAGIFSLVAIASRRATRKTNIPFGPFLIAGALFAVLR